MSKNKETGKHTQSKLPKCSFNLRGRNASMLEAIKKELGEISGSNDWTRTEVINFSIEFVYRNLPLYKKSTTKNDSVEN